MSASTALRDRLLAQPVDRHDREQLVDGPAVRQRLEDREIAEIGVRQDVLQVLELLGKLLEPAAHVADARAARPVEPLGQAAELERQQAEIEHLQRLLARGQRIVIALDQPPLVDVAVGVEQVAHRLRQRAARRRTRRRSRAVDPEAIERRAAEHVEDQHAVVRGDGAPGFADDQRMRDVARIADAADRGRPRRWRTR